MMKIWAVALNTFREALRDKVLYSLLFFSVLMIGFAVILDHLTVGERTKIIKDFGLASLSLFGILIAIFVGIGLVYKEIERKTIFNILSKPVRRYQFVIGKYLGLLATLFIVTALMTVLFLTMLYLYIGETDFLLLYAIGMSFLELMVIMAFAVLFSSFSTPMLSGFFTLSFVVIGHLISDLKALGERSASLAAKYLTQVIYVVFPDLELFNLKGAVVYQMPIEKEYLYYATCYGILYTLFTLGLAVLVFNQREFR